MPPIPSELPRSPIRPLKRIAPVVALVVALVALGRLAGMHLPAFALWIEDLGLWGPVVFVAAYVTATVALVPGGLLTLTSGALFGLVEGTIYAFIGETLGGVAAFVISRRVARRTVERRLAGNPRFTALERAVRARGRTIIFLLRLSPAIPFNFLNYALGLTNVRFVDYVLASVGMLPATLLYVYYGRLAGDVAELASGAEIERDAAYYAMLALGLVATVLVTTFVTRLARRELAKVAAEGEPMPAGVAPLAAAAPAPSTTKGPATGRAQTTDPHV